METAQKYTDRLNRSTSFIANKIQCQPRWCVVLGSGLGGLGYRLNQPLVEIPYSDIPGYPRSNVQGHSGKLICGQWAGQGVIVMEGRFHRYEGLDWSTLVLPVRSLLRLGVSHFILTNAAGGIREDLIPGDLMLISDHLNLMGGNPLIGPNHEEFGPRFPAMTHCYDFELRKALCKAAEKRTTLFKDGVYAALSGPNYETSAEIRMLKTLGADAVGMSTVPEIIGISHGGGKAAAVSLITNSTGGSHVPTHNEVMEMANRSKDSLHHVILDVISTFDV